MPKVHSHYENLKVPRDASAQDIRAAYRALTRQYHPDRNPGNAEAERVMSVINVAYDVLSVPAKRTEHDEWIAGAEAEAPRGRPLRHGTTLHAPSGRFQDSGRARVPPEVRQAAFEKRVRRALVHLRGHRLGYGLGLAALLGLGVFGIGSMLAPGLLAPEPDLALAGQKMVGYARAEVAPNGKPWPSQSGYLEGFPVMNRNGLSEVTVDNSQNDADMFAKLYSLDGPTALPVRTFFVMAHARFVLSELATGTYDLRYRNLASGNLARSPPLILEEVATAHGPQPSTAHVKLYGAATGNMLSYSLPESDF